MPIPRTTSNLFVKSPVKYSTQYLSREEGCYIIEEDELIQNTTFTKDFSDIVLSMFSLTLFF